MIIHLIPSFVSGGPKVTLSGETNTVGDAVAPHDTFASLKIDADGNVYMGDAVNGAAISYTQVDTGTDWIRPAAAASSLYEVRVTSVDHNAGSDNGSGWDVSPGTDGDWFTLDTDRIWNTNETTVGSYSTTFTVEIRRGSTTLASASYALNIENTL